MTSWPTIDRAAQRCLAPLMAWMLFAAIAIAPPAWADDVKPPITRAPSAEQHESLTRSAPASVDDLRQIQTLLQQRLPAARAATVGIMAGSGQGSGVIVSRDGYVLTAGHVSGEPGRDVTVILPDGKRVAAKTLGNSPIADAGMLRITEDGEYPFAPLGQSSRFQPGAWTFALGYPGGYDKARGPVLRLGRIIAINDNVVQTDCTLLGGDSGGPLFDFEGNVIGIHSRIARSTESNYHAPVDAYARDWDRLAKGEIVPLPPRLVERIARPRPNQAFLGVRMSESDAGVLVEDVVDGSAAAAAGIRTGDIITQFGKQRIADAATLVGLIRQKNARDRVTLRVLRDGKDLELDIEFGAWPGGNRR